MPPKITVTKDQVLEATLALLRREGLNSLTARRLAQELGCSTQPVYRVYRSMDELKHDVLLKAQEIVEGYLSPADGKEPPFLAVGLGSLRLARDEPHLYRALVQDGPALRDFRQGKPPPEFILERMRAEPLLAGLSDEQLIRINTLMWFFSQGLATLFFTDGDEDPMATAQDYMMKAGQAVIAFELNQGRNPKP